MIYPSPMPSQLRRYNELGDVHFWTISCYHRLRFFGDDGMKQVIIDGLRQLQEQYAVCLVGYVIMPEHVHVLVYPHEKGPRVLVPISRLLHGFKKHVGYHGKQRLREVWRTRGRLWTKALSDWACGDKRNKSIWTTRGYDFNINRRHTMIEKLEYCHKNPVTRQLVDLAEHWRWSSFRYYEQMDDVLLPMDWDGSWPIEW